MDGPQRGYGGGGQRLVTTPVVGSSGGGGLGLFAPSFAPSLPYLPPPQRILAVQSTGLKCGVSSLCAQGGCLKRETLLVAKKMSRASKLTLQLSRHWRVETVETEIGILALPTKLCLAATHTLTNSLTHSPPMLTLSLIATCSNHSYHLESCNPLTPHQPLISSSTLLVICVFVPVSEPTHLSFSPLETEIDCRAHGRAEE